MINDHVHTSESAFATVIVPTYNNILLYQLGENIFFIYR